MPTRVAVAVCVFFFVSACRVIDPAPPPEAPRIGSFTASKTRTAPGEEVTLSFTTTGATKIELTDDSGSAIQLEGAVDSGTAKVAPTRTAFYVLRATGAGGRDTAFVQIAVNEPLKDLFLIAVPAAIDSGEQAQLLWGAPGASTVTLKAGDGSPTTLTGTTGSVTVTPANTERYTLTAQGAPGSPPLTALAGVQVRPVLFEAAVAAPDGVEAGKTLTFSWRTAGATRVTIREQTFGQLVEVTDPASVIDGTFAYVLPAKLPGGIDVTEGLPLRFTVSAMADDVVVSKILERAVGLRPVIELLRVPGNVSAGHRFTVDWKTLNANGITIAVGGLPIFRTLPGDQARVELGSVSLPAPTAQTDYTFIASNALGLSIERTFTVRPVTLPVINTFTLTGAFNTIGDAVTARWTTTNANRVVVRFENGPTLATVTAASQVASGNVVLTPANTARITLEAWNLAGDFVQETRAVTYNGTAAVSVTPTPVFRTAQAQLNWTLSTAGVLEVVGLPTSAPAPAPNSGNFIDLNSVPTAEPLFFADPSDGAEVIPALRGFRFPLLGKVQNSLWVSVNGFIAFSKPAALNSNTDFSDAGDTAPSMIAPLWDNLSMGPNSKVLYALRTSPLGENLLVVQWEQMQIAGDPASELTFEAQLFETGQVAFIYKTLTPAVTTATIGVKDTVFPAAQQYAFDSITTQPIADLELTYFSGGPADGTLPFKAGATGRLEFFGRTATGRVPTSAEVRSFGTGEVAVNEVMPFPEVSVASTGQWIELRNRTAGTVNLEGLRFDTLSSADAGFFLPPGSVLDAGAVLVIGQSQDTNATGGAVVQVAEPTLTLGAVDRVRVLVGSTVLSTYSWDAGVAGSSLQPLGDDLLIASGQTLACPRTQTFGLLGAVGTPGARNESCAAYVLSSIPGRFTTAPAGSEILTTLETDDDTGDVTLPRPFTYFGTATSTAQLSTNGFLSLGAAGWTDSLAFRTNRTTASTSAPNGVVAPFWEDLVRSPNGKNAMWREADRTIISWEGFSVFGFESSTLVNAQLHLLDDGNLEFHYGELSSSSTTQSTIDLVRGSSATVWIERPDGVVVVVSSINQLNSIAPNSGIRFTPRP